MCKIVANFMKPFAQKRTTEVKKQPSVISDLVGRKTFCVWADFASAKKKKFNCVGSFFDFFADTGISFTRA